MDSQKPEILHFHGLILSKSYQGSATKVQKSYLSWHRRVTQNLKKNWPVVSNVTWKIWWIFTQPLKSLKSSIQWTPFVENIQGLSYKKTGDLSFMTLDSDAKLNKSWPCDFKNSMRNCVNFHWSTQKSEKLYFDEIFFSKAYNVSARKSHKNYVP